MIGYSKGRSEPKYDITSQQYSALKDQFNLWKSNLREPDKVLAHINEELRKKHNSSSVDSAGSNKPKLAVFKSQ